jgi:hypothetical protein
MRVTINPDHYVVTLEKMADADDSAAKGALDAAYRMARLIGAHDSKSETAEQLKTVNAVFTELRGYPIDDGWTVRLSVEQVALATMAASLMASTNGAKEYHETAASQLNVIQERIFEATADAALRAATHPTKTPSEPWGGEPDDYVFEV